MDESFLLVKDVITNDHILQMTGHRSGGECTTSPSSTVMGFGEESRRNSVKTAGQKAHTQGAEWKLNHNPSAVCVYICRAGGPGPDSHGNR